MTNYTPKGVVVVVMVVIEVVVIRITAERLSDPVLLSYPF